MRVLIITNMLPTAANPRAGAFIERQIAGLEQIGVRTNVLFLDRPANGMHSYVRLRGLIQSRLKAGVDLVHIMYGGIFGLISLLTARGCQKVISFGGTDINGGSFGSLFFRLRLWAGVLASRLAVPLADGIIVKSQRMADKISSLTKGKPVWIIPNGVDLERFKPLDREDCQRKLGWDDHQFNILFSTNDSRILDKRLDLANRAVKLLRQRGVDAVLHGLDKVPHEVVPDWINASDAFLLTSLAEGSPNLVKETLACDVPVVSVDVGDVGERIDGVEGCFLSEDTPEALADNLMKVYRSYDRVKGREKMQELTIEKVGLRLLDVYQTVLAVHNASQSTAVVSRQ